MTGTETIRRIEPQAAGWSRRTAHLSGLGLWLLSLALFWKAWGGLVGLALHDQNSSHILIIPLISAFFLHLNRKAIFGVSRYCPSIGIPLLLLAVVLHFGLQSLLSALNNTDRLSLEASLIVLMWLGGFLLCYGAESFRASAFPLVFLLLMIPLPAFLADHAVFLLQKGSAETCYGLFRLAGVPFIRHGFQFSLPGVDIEVAAECSGIRSGLSLFITGLLAAHVLLQGPWKKACMVLSVIPITICKNAVRIVTISWLGIHVDSSFFHGQLHRQGGLPFSLLALAMMALLIWVLGPISKNRPAVSSVTKRALPNPSEN